MSKQSPEDLFGRTKRFAIQVFRLVDQLPESVSARVIAYQLAKCGSSQAANYREARRARSNKEFISKISISIQETEETRFWLEVIRELFPDIESKGDSLLSESSQLIAIFTASVKTASSRKKL